MTCGPLRKKVFACVLLHRNMKCKMDILGRVLLRSNTLLFKILFSFKFSNERKCKNNYGNISFLRKTFFFFAIVNSRISLSPGLFKRYIMRFVEETFCTLKIASN